MRLSKPSLPQLFPLQASLVAPPPSQLGSFRDSGVGSVNGTAITVVSSFVVKADEKVFSCTSNLATKCGANANDANPTSSLDKSDELLGVANISPKQSAVTTPSSFGNSQFRRFYTHMPSRMASRQPQLQDSCASSEEKRWATLRRWPCEWMRCWRALLDSRSGSGLLFRS
mmetsp:Transcript_82733/g.221851  ORF Transcript_82733/g.221851 Transcript_82733/m.221851 type:complete len:171 (-) Transcript_82733:749-1261(-)